MTRGQLALAIAFVAVLGAAVYLFVEVRATPAEAQVTVPHTTAPHASEVASAQPSAPLDTRATPTSPRPAPTGSAPSSSDSTPPPNLGVELQQESPAERNNEKWLAVMDQANKAYDRQDFEEARAIAGKVLSKDPKNIRMLRIMVSSNCIEGDPVQAQTYFEKLPKYDREQMKTRCSTYGVTFKEPAGLP